jgi:hypothetical protein
MQERFPFVYAFERPSGRLLAIRSEMDVYRFLWANAVFGPVDNLMCSFTDVAPDAPGADDAWQRRLAEEAEAARRAAAQGDTVAEARQAALRAVQERDAARDDLAAARGELDAMRETVSWRVTAPLRAVRRRSGGRRPGQ